MKWKNRKIYKLENGLASFFMELDLDDLAAYMGCATFY